MSDEHGEYDQDDQMPAAAPATVLPRAAEDSTPPEGAVEAPQAAAVHAPTADEIREEDANFTDLLPAMPPIDSANHPLPLHDPHWHAIKQWVRREIWMAERGFSLAARERNNP